MTKTTSTKTAKRSIKTATKTKVGKKLTRRVGVKRTSR